MDELENQSKDKQETASEEHMDTKGYQKPPIDLLNKPSPNKNAATKANKEAINQNAAAIEKVTRDFGVEVKVATAHIGPSVTQYELEVKSGTRLSKITALNKEIALDLGAKDVRIQAPIPGKKTVGIELPNKVNASVSFKEKQK